MILRQEDGWNGKWLELGRIMSIGVESSFSNNRQFVVLGGWLVWFEYMMLLCVRMMCDVKLSWQLTLKKSSQYVSHCHLVKNDRCFRDHLCLHHQEYDVTVSAPSHLYTFPGLVFD